MSHETPLTALLSKASARQRQLLMLRANGADQQVIP
jgi:hypothetical protein